jgi:hypothetical protein
VLIEMHCYVCEPFLSVTILPACLAAGWLVAIKKKATFIGPVSQS